MHYSFFKLQDNNGYIGYPTDVVSETLNESPEIAIANIDTKSEEITKNLPNLSKIEMLGGGVVFSSLKLIPNDSGIVVAEIFDKDFDYYIGNYEALAQANEDYIDHISNNVVQKLQEALTAEYQQWDAYVSMSRIIFGFHRDPIVKEFLDHANDEYQHIISVSDMLVNSGIRPSTKRVSFQDATDTTGIIKVNLDMEEKAVKTYQDILKVINDESSPIAIDIQTILSKENEHARDLRVLLRYL
jgi:bacterioferritin